MGYGILYFDFYGVLLIASVILSFIVYYVKNRHLYWAKRKVPFVRPSSFIMGSTGEVLLKKISLYDYHANMYNLLAPHKFGGYYNFLTPVLIVRDPELIKNIFTKDFSYFMNRTTEPLDENDPLSQHLFNLKGEKWRVLRAKLSPAFTSGKIKVMFDLMKECTEDLFELINTSIQKDESIEIKETMARFTTDVISSCVFGLKSNSQKDPNSIFRKMGRRTFQPTIRGRILAIFYMLIPKLREILKIPLLDKDIGKFFKSLVTQTIKYREENGFERNDFLDLLIALKNQEVLSHNSASGDINQLEFTENLLTAQCFVFFIAGFETSSGTLTWALYELAKHPEIQETLFSEIETTVNENGGSLTYECLQKMIYLEQVIFETLRMYPLLPVLSRICNENHRLDDRFTIEKNTRVLIPVKGLHYDPLYYENPDEFNPENFSKEAKAKRHHFTFLPFGEGPRICIGMRFGLMQVKLGLASLISHYSVSLSPNMSESIIYEMSTFLPTPKHGVWLKFERRVL